MSSNPRYNGNPGNGAVMQNVYYRREFQAPKYQIQVAGQVLHKFGGTEEVIKKSQGREVRGRARVITSIDKYGLKVALPNLDQYFLDASSPEVPNTLNPRYFADTKTLVDALSSQHYQPNPNTSLIVSVSVATGTPTTELDEMVANYWKLNKIL